MIFFFLYFKGTNALDIFEGKHLPLRLGYIGIVNRSQKDINGKISINRALEKEKEFFNNSSYKTIMHKMGTRFLQETLNKQLTSHINEKLPSIRTSLQNKLNDLEKTKYHLGIDEHDDIDTTRHFIRCLDAFKEDVSSALEGRSLAV